MEDAVGTNHRVRFKAFELDLHTRELYRNGIRLRVQGQPIDVLEMLLERPGELVTREALRKKLWPEHTFVDFEHSLNSAVTRLRDALGDSAEDPRYIETLPRLGYRFIEAAVTENNQVFAPAVSAPRVLAEVVPISEPQHTSSQLAVSTGSIPRIRLRGRRWPWLFAAGLAAAVGIVLMWMAWFSPAPTLVVTSIEPLTHDGLPKYNPRSDGIRVYFVEFVHGRDLLSQVSADGGDISRIASPFNNTAIYDVAPDGSKLLISEISLNVPHAFWALSLPSGTAHRLGPMEGNYAFWSPDGKQLIFTKALSIWTADSNGENTRKLMTTSGAPWMVHLSPDGERIRYSLWSSGSYALWESRSDGSAAHALLPGWHTQLAHAGGEWSPDGRYYAFLEGTGKISNIWLLPERRIPWPHRRATPVQLTQGPLSFEYLSFCPDGRTLLAKGVQSRGELVRYDPGTRQVSPYLSGISAGDLAFSRDGQWMAYVTHPDETLWRCRIDGSNCLQLTVGNRAALPQWSPDGRSIAYVKGELGRLDKIAIIPMNGGNAEEADQEGRSEGNPNWSPDGKKIIFDSYIFADAESWEIREMDLQDRKITSIPGSKGLHSPRLSPDGRYLAALTADTQSLMLFDFNKKLWTIWVTAQEVNTRNLANPIWSVDGRFLYFSTLPVRGVGDVQEWRIRPGQRFTEKILDLHDEPRYQGVLGGSWSSVGPDGAVYFTRDRSSSEIYAIHLSEK